MYTPAPAPRTQMSDTLDDFTDPMEGEPPKKRGQLGYLYIYILYIYIYNIHIVVICKDSDSFRNF